MAQTWRRSWWKILALALCAVKSLFRGVKTVYFSVNRSYAWIAPVGSRPRLTQIDIVQVDSMEKRRTNQMTDAVTVDSPVKKHFSDLLENKVELERSYKRIESRKRQNADAELDVKNSNEPSIKRSQEASKEMTIKSSSRKPKSTKQEIAYDNDYIQLDYDTKTQPFRHIEQGDIKIPNFANTWNAIVDMRQGKDAPVDTMGAHCCADVTQGKRIYQYQTLIACMLSSQTKDAVTAAAMDALKQRGLTPENISKMPEDELDSIISKVGFHKTKAKHIKQATEMILNKFGGNVPDNIEDLVTLPGVGPKMGNLVLQIGFKRINGIAVDLHVHRIANRLQWVKTKTPEETRIKLQELIPKTLWAEVNHLLVGFGQTVCVAAGPGCGTCLANTWCPVGKANLAKSNKT